MQIFETISLILCVVIFTIILVVLRFIAIEFINEHPHKCKNCGEVMKATNFYIFSDNNGHHGIFLYECPTCGMKEEIYY